MKIDPTMLADRQKRFFAYLIDIIPIGLIVFGFYYFFLGFDIILDNYSNRNGDTQPRIEFLKQRNWIRDITFLVWIVYCIFMEASVKQGTFGKLVMGIKVVKENGCRMSIKESISRNLSKIISYFIFSLGFIWILFDRNKQGWHDKMNKTYVVEKNHINPEA
jgi:uncharacterized RDD family membrane protein YckC